MPSHPKTTRCIRLVVTIATGDRPRYGAHAYTRIDSAEAWLPERMSHDAQHIAKVLPSGFVLDGW